MSERITILGGGSWGLAIARLLDKNGHHVRVWEYNAEDYALIVEHRTHPKKLPGCRLPQSIIISNDLREAVSDAEIIVSAVPSQVQRRALAPLKAYLPTSCGVVNLAKGIETDSLQRMSEVIGETLDLPSDRIVTLSGPSHAEEVSRDLPTTVVVAGKGKDFVQKIQSLFSADSFRVYCSGDLVGVELGGSLKNIIAIAAGITAGLGMGDNTLGALITRGLAEMTRLGVIMGADPLTFAGLSGVGDLVTTCASQHSRNRYVGEQIGMGKTLDVVLQEMSMVAEGVQTTKSGMTLANKYDVEMPITTAVYDVLFADKSPKEAVGELMTRELKSEIWS